MSCRRGRSIPREVGTSHERSGVRPPRRPTPHPLASPCGASFARVGHDLAMSERAEANADLAMLFAYRVWMYKQGEMVSLLIHLGDRLGLYRALDGAGPVTADELAARTC